LHGLIKNFYVGEINEKLIDGKNIVCIVSSYSNIKNPCTILKIAD